MVGEDKADVGAAERLAAAVVFALLVLATVAAFACSQRLKRDPLVLDRVTFVARRSRRTAVHASPPTATAATTASGSASGSPQSDHGDRRRSIKPGGRVVVTLARDRFLKRYRFHTFYWDGRQRGGGTAPPGPLQAAGEAARRGPDLVPPGVIRLHRAPARRHAASRVLRRSRPG